MVMSMAVIDAAAPTSRRGSLCNERDLCSSTHGPAAKSGERLILELDVASEPIDGRLQSADGAKREFRGYMGLISLLEQTRVPAEPPSQPTAAERLRERGRD